MKKKLIGLMFAATMLFGASMTVFAADASGNDVVDVSGNNVVGTGDIEMTGEVKKPTLSVTITKGTKVIANPYGLTVNDSEDTLIGSDITFENKSDVPLAIGLKGSITLPTYAESVAKDAKVTIASDLNTVQSATTKMVFVQAEIDDGAGNKLKTARGKDVTLVYAAKPAALEENPVLAKAGDTTTGVSSTMRVKIGGGTSKSPTSEWDATADAFTVTTTYDIQFATTGPSTFGS